MSTSSTGGARGRESRDDRAKGEAGNTSDRGRQPSAPAPQTDPGRPARHHGGPPALNPNRRCTARPGVGPAATGPDHRHVMSILDTSIVNVRVPVIQKQFGVQHREHSVISTSYTLTEGVIVPMSAWLGRPGRVETALHLVRWSCSPWPPRCGSVRAWAP